MCEKKRTSVSASVKHILFHEDPGSDAHGDDRDDQRRDPRLCHRQTSDIHAIEAKDDVRNRHDDRDDGQHLHDDVEVVGNDRCKGIHRTGKDVGIDVTHLDRLVDLDQHIIQQILIFFIELDEFTAHDLVEHDLIGL